MGPTDRATIMANTEQRGRRRNVCGSVTDSLYKSLGSGMHNMMDSIVSKIIYKPKPKYHKKMHESELTESIDLSQDPLHGKKLADIDKNASQNQNLTVNNVTNYNVFNDQK